MIRVYAWCANLKEPLQQKGGGAGCHGGGDACAGTHGETSLGERAFHLDSGGGDVRVDEVGPCIPSAGGECQTAGGAVVVRDNNGVERIGGICQGIIRVRVQKIDFPADKFRERQPDMEASIDDAQGLDI